MKTLTNSHDCTMVTFVCLPFFTPQCSSRLRSVLENSVSRVGASNVNYQQFGAEFIKRMESLPNPSKPVSRDTYIDLLRKNVGKEDKMEQGNRSYIKFLEYMHMLVRPKDEKFGVVMPHPILIY